MPADRREASGVAADCRDLVQIYPSDQGGVTVLRGIHATFPKGTLTSIVGASGAGKSTLLRLLACLEAPSAGQVTIAGQPTSRLTARARRRLVARRIGYVFQRPPDNLIDYLTAAAHLRLAWQMRESATVLDVEQLLASVALSGAAKKRPDELSDGEQQRLAVAIAVAGDPDLIIADEPTADLDPAGAAALADSIVRLTKAGRTFVVSSHDPVVTDRSDQVLVIRRGVLAAVKSGRGPLRVMVDPAGRIQLPDEALRQLPGRVAEVVVEGDVITLQQP
ncbi:MAG: putative transport system ATP-binding protein [Acidimicrobiaceae bacterium]|jgi:ABC-type lipoprotein export system ATPase subunit|nr:putative transport system ATP-binding protein [Acidimicrobiaceae bacterium]MDQ1369502.1 putative transport system ATP-binding protein [Acidimicrobiaceae bacterium]MDQ1378019.1 putative transport system ATP-binding protein [Acidimicrobiaceae bacterium]MDQ1398728.1 putative transport system ATP-binding protein [Acidimicrobiaceae bacterium]MDQ1411895.1 putative transport system ATP-binding protein [Acidimicrobiaceae bacterium]